MPDPHRTTFPPRALQLAALDYATATVNTIATSIEAAALSPSSARAVWAEIIDQAQARRDQVKEDAADAS